MPRDDGVDGLRQDPSPEGAFNYNDTISVVINVWLLSSWVLVIGLTKQVKEIRHTFVNALVEKMYKDFSYKKVLSKELNKKSTVKKYNVEKRRLCHR